LRIGHDPGRGVIVDSSRASALASTLDQLKRDLIADGWDVPNLDFAHPEYYTVPRHVDYPDPPSRPGSDFYRVNNYNNVLATGSRIHNWLNPDPAVANVALLIGHVPVPHFRLSDGQSGAIRRSSLSDGHLRRMRSRFDGLWSVYAAIEYQNRDCW
jgi:hypothetical protein